MYLKVRILNLDNTQIKKINKNYSLKNKREMCFQILGDKQQKYEPRYEKSGFLHMRKQRLRS